jgi:hypothetical protein
MLVGNLDSSSELKTLRISPDFTKVSIINKNPLRFAGVCKDALVVIVEKNKTQNDLIVLAVIPVEDGVYGPLFPFKKVIVVRTTNLRIIIVNLVDYSWRKVEGIQCITQPYPRHTILFLDSMNPNESSESKILRFLKEGPEISWRLLYSPTMRGVKAEKSRYPVYMLVGSSLSLCVGNDQICVFSSINPHRLTFLFMDLQIDAIITKGRMMYDFILITHERGESVGSNAMRLTNLRTRKTLTGKFPYPALYSYFTQDCQVMGFASPFRGEMKISSGAVFFPKT